MEKFKFLLLEKIKQLPKGPGVYCFKGGKKIIYIGKAANIRERTKNHFQQPTYQDNFFVNQVEKIGYIKTDSKFAEPSVHLTSHSASQGSTIEALILEANLIKKYQPKYNVVWRDDKNYFFVGITKPARNASHSDAGGEDFPRIFITHQSSKDAEYIGPFVDGKSLKETLKILRKIFPYRSCNKIPKHPCLWYQLGRCPAPCLSKSSLAQQGEEGKTSSSPFAAARVIEGFTKSIMEECQQNAENIIKFLKKGKVQTLRDLKKEMKLAAITQDFERAAKIRNQVMALEKVLSHARILKSQGFVIQKTWDFTQKILQKILKIKEDLSRIEAYDISNIQGQQATGSMITFINGSPDKNFYRKFKIEISGKPNDIAMIKEVLNRRFKHAEWPFPDLILIDGGKAQLNAALNCKLQTANYKLIKVVALAKKKNELYIEGQKKPILLKSLPREIFNLILQLRDEAHRFAISYHKKLREKSFIKD